jgi:HEAT repeat protein
MNSFGHPGTALDLLTDFNNPSPLVRESAVKVAVYLGLHECYDAVLACCQDASERVRRAAIEQLPSIPDPRVFSALVHAIESDTASVRAAAATALSKIEDAPAAESLLAARLEDEDVWVRYFAIRSLTAINRLSGVVSALARLAEADPAMQVRIAAVEALAQCGPQAFFLLARLSQSAESDLSYAALESLGAIEHVGRFEILDAALKSDDSERRIRAIRAFARTHHPIAIQPLLAIAIGRDEREAREAIDGLLSLKMFEAAQALVQAASIPARRDRCIAALAGMANLAVPALAEGLRGGDVDTKRVIVEVLTRIRTPEAVELLEAALTDTAPGVRFAALVSLSNIRHSPRAGIAAHGQGES